MLGRVRDFASMGLCSFLSSDSMSCSIPAPRGSAGFGSVVLLLQCDPWLSYTFLTNKSSFPSRTVLANRANFTFVALLKSVSHRY